MVNDMKALVISTNESGAKALLSLLENEHCPSADIAESSKQAVGMLEKSSYDLIVINAPLSDENGLELSAYCAENTRACVFLLIQQERAMQAFELVDRRGVMVMSKPLNKRLFHHYLRFCAGFRDRLVKPDPESERLKTKLEEMSVVNRAKLLLMQCLSMSEQQAHRYIEKQAMNMRTSRLDIAKQVIRTYEN